jgi:hypothetical protein
MALRFSLAFLLCCLSHNIYSQTKVSVPDASSRMQQLQKDLANFRTQIVSLEQTVDSLQKTVEIQGYVLKTKQERQDSISLNLTEHTFQRLDTDTGFFLISVMDAVPYLNGYKLHLRIGNPSYAGYSAAKLTVKWNKQYQYDKYTEASFSEWQKSYQTKETTLLDTLTAGSWNSVELILAPATTEQLGIVTLSMNTDTVFLISK